MKLVEITTNYVKEGIDSFIDGKISSVKKSIHDFFANNQQFDEMCLIGIIVCIVCNIVDFPGMRKLGGMIFFIWLFVKFMVGG
jgi:hypothetical protein